MPQAVTIGVHAGVGQIARSVGVRVGPVVGRIVRPAGAIVAEVSIDVATGERVERVVVLAVRHAVVVVVRIAGVSQTVRVRVDLRGVGVVRAVVHVAANGVVVHVVEHVEGARVA